VQNNKLRDNKNPPPLSVLTERGRIFSVSRIRGDMPPPSHGYR